MRLLVEPVLKSDEEMPPEKRSELAFREPRLLFTGADREARLSLAAWKDLDHFTKSDRLLASWAIPTVASKSTRTTSMSSDCE